MDAIKPLLQKIKPFFQSSKKGMGDLPPQPPFPLPVHTHTHTHTHIHTHTHTQTPVVRMTVKEGTRRQQTEQILSTCLFHQKI